MRLSFRVDNYALSISLRSDVNRRPLSFIPDVFTTRCLAEAERVTFNGRPNRPRPFMAIPSSLAAGGAFQREQSPSVYRLGWRAGALFIVSQVDALTFGRLDANPASWARCRRAHLLPVRHWVCPVPVDASRLEPRDALILQRRRCRHCPGRCRRRR